MFVPIDGYYEQINLCSCFLIVVLTNKCFDYILKVQKKYLKLIWILSFWILKYSSKLKVSVQFWFWLRINIIEHYYTKWTCFGYLYTICNLGTPTNNLKGGLGFKSLKYLHKYPVNVYFFTRDAGIMYMYLLWLSSVWDKFTFCGGYKKLLC